MKMPYYPGCTLYSKAKALDNSTRDSMAVLGVELAELPKWTCCGTTFPLAQENYMSMVAAARILSSVAKDGGTELVTICSFCYNVLKRVNHLIKYNDTARNKLNCYLEENYAGEVTIVHPLEICKRHVGFNVIQSMAGQRLEGLKVACYYGCMLVRPASEMEFDEPENPTIMEGLVSALGAKAVEYPKKTACCGSYQVLHDNDMVMERVRDILSNATSRGADLVVTSCPLCQFNLDWFQGKILQHNTGYQKIPVIYFTQLLGLALGVPRENLGLGRVQDWENLFSKIDS